MPDVRFKPRDDIVGVIRSKLEEERNRRQPSPVVVELLARGFEQKLMELYEEFQQAKCSLGYLAEQLGVGTWELHHILEERGLKPTNL